MKITRRTAVNLILDTVLLVGYVVDDAFRLTGLTWHEWIGVALIALFVVHLLLHADWIGRVTRRFVHRLPARERLTWIVDLVLYVSMGFVLVSGILISRAAMPFLGWTPGRDRFWTGMHSTFASLVVFAVAAHIALSWAWARTVFRRLFRRRPGRPTATVAEVVS